MLKKFAATGLVATAAAGALMFSAPAYADIESDNDGSILSGNQLVVTVCGNNVQVINVVPIGIASCKISDNDTTYKY
jgi:hypothetical protein